MSRPRLFGTNGVRFLPGKDRSLDFVLSFAQAIGTYFQRGTVLVGLDGRVSGPAMAKAVSSGLMAAGVDVAEEEMAPTPCIQFSVRKFGYQGGVMITASHNPPEYNGIKVMGPEGVEISRSDELVIEDVFYVGSYKSVDWKSVGTVVEEKKCLNSYIEGIISHVDAKRIGRKGFKVVLDLGNGMQALAAPHIMEKLGCKVMTMNSHVDGEFPGRGAEPTPDKIRGLAETVVSVDADLGIAYDGDGDRSIFCDEKGIIHYGDRSGALIANHVLAKRPGATLVTTVSTSQLIDYVASKHRSRVVRTKVGSVDVSRTMLDCGALLGLEENGGCFYAPHVSVRDGAIASALFLEALTESTEKASELLGSLPRYHQAKLKFKCDMEARSAVMEAVGNTASGKVERVDGLKVWTDEHTWILVRPSGTEPLIRVFAESDQKTKLDRMVEKFTNVIEEKTKKVWRGA